MQELVTSTASSLRALPSSLSRLSQTALTDAGQPPDPVRLSELVKTEAAKVGLMCGAADAQPPMSELQPLLQGFQQALTALCLSLHACTRDAGPTFKHDLRTLYTNSAEHGAAVAEAVLKPADMQRAVGNMWDTTDTIKAPLTNKSALFKRMGASLRSINDAIREMAEMEQQPLERIEEGSSSDGEGEGEGEQGSGGLQSSSHPHPDVSRPDAATNGHANGHAPDQGTGPHSRAEDAGDGEDKQGSGSSSICDYETGALSVGDRDVARSSHALMTVAADVLKLLSRQLLQGPDHLTGAPLEAWENCIWHAKNLQGSIEDLGAAMYPPQDLDEVEQTSEGVVVTVQCMLEEVPQEYLEQGTNERVSQLQVSLEGAEQRIRAAIQAGRREQ